MKRGMQAAQEDASRDFGIDQEEDAVEDKFEKYFGYLARCEGKFCATTLKT